MNQPAIRATWNCYNNSPCFAHGLQSGALFADSALIGRIARAGFLMVAVTNTVALTLRESDGLARALRAGTALLALAGFFWARRRTPSYPARLVVGIAISMLVAANMFAESRFGWPARMDMVAPAVVVLALLVNWTLAFTLACATLTAVL